MELQPFDDFVFKGLQQRFQQVFGCPAYIVTTNEEAVIAELTQGGKKLEYPYAFLKLQSSGPNSESYAANYLSRHGLVVFVEDNGLVAHRVRLIPTLFDFEIKYVTDKFLSTEDGSVRAFIRRWMFARRTGELQFNVRYGRISAGIKVALGDSLPFTPRENAPDNETAYQLIGNVTAHGYVSEPMLGKVGVANQVALEQVLESEGLAGGQFFPFTKEK